MANRTIINGRYALSALKKQGGMADLYVGTDLDQDAKKVAIKLFHREYSDDGILREAFRGNNFSLPLRPVSSRTRRLHAPLITVAASARWRVRAPDAACVEG